MKYISLILIIISVSFETVADILFKEWSINNKQIILYAGIGLYTISTVIWAYSLKYNYLSKAIIAFTILNLVAVLVFGFVMFNEHVNTANKVGIALGLISVVLLYI